MIKLVHKNYYDPVKLQEETPEIIVKETVRETGKEVKEKETKKKGRTKKNV